MMQAGSCTAAISNTAATFSPVFSTKNTWLRTQTHNTHQLIYSTLQFSQGENDPWKLQEQLPACTNPNLFIALSSHATHEL